jgi:hypothetical protein
MSFSKTAVTIMFLKLQFRLNSAYTLYFLLQRKSASTLLQRTVGQDCLGRNSCFFLLRIEGKIIRGQYAVWRNCRDFHPHGMIEPSSDKVNAESRISCFHLPTVTHTNHYARSIFCSLVYCGVKGRNLHLII